MPSDCFLHRTAQKPASELFLMLHCDKPKFLLHTIFHGPENDITDIPDSKSGGAVAVLHICQRE